MAASGLGGHLVAVRDFGGDLHAAYPVAYIVGDSALYDFLDPGSSSFAPTAGGLLVPTVVLAVLGCAARTLLVSARTSTYARDIS